MSLNVQAVGRIGTKPEISKINSNEMLCRFAVNDVSNGANITNWFTLHLDTNNKHYMNMIQYLDVGKIINVNGFEMVSIKCGTNNGCAVKLYRDIYVTNIDFLPSSKRIEEPLHYTEISTEEKDDKETEQILGNVIRNDSNLPF